MTTSQTAIFLESRTFDSYCCDCPKYKLCSLQMLVFIECDGWIMTGYKRLDF